MTDFLELTQPNDLTIESGDGTVEIAQAAPPAAAESVGRVDPVLFHRDCCIIWPLAFRRWFGIPSGPG